MAYDEDLAGRVREAIGARKGVAEIKMFGGLCFTINGNMSCGVSKDELIVRVAPERSEALLKRPGTHVMDFMKTARTPKGFVVVEPRALKTQKQLEAWVAMSVEFAASFPPKVKKAKKAKPRT